MPRAGWAAHTLLVTQSSADARGSAQAVGRRCSRRAIRRYVIDGGELLPMGQEDATRNISARAAAAADAGRWSAVDRQQPVVVRSYAEANSSTHLVVNECPWSVDAELALDVPADAELERLTGFDRRDAERRTGAAAPGERTSELGRCTLSRTGSRQCGFRRPGVEGVGDSQRSVSEAAKAELQAQLSELTDRDLTVPSKYGMLANPGFEPTGAGDALPGWHVVRNGRRRDRRTGRHEAAEAAPAV